MDSTQLQPHHKLEVQCRVGSLSIDIKLELSRPWTLLYGPSGSGKSSLLRAACGLLNCSGIRFSRRSEDDTWQALQDTPSHLRGVRWAPQHATLFPHLTVRQNIEFGARSIPRSTRGSSTQHQALVDDAIRLLRVDNLTSRLPRDLSGGERQRVNLARAFAAPECQLMLLDEPFAGIDHALRDELLPEMRSWLRQQGVPCLSVSHDVEEAFQLQPEVILIRDGRVEAQGEAVEVLQPERERLLRTLKIL